MAQYNITIDSEILHYLFLKGLKMRYDQVIRVCINQVLQHKL